MKNKLAKWMEEALRSCQSKGLLPEAVLDIEIEAPANPEHGDYACNLAMILASRAKQNPRNIARILQENFPETADFVENITIAGPGFINFRIKDSLWRQVLQTVLEQKEQYGRFDIGKGKKVQLEFVSANPTGPLHIGHARGAVVGDVLANLLETGGYAVSREYYVNDAGNQMNNLGKSVFYRLRQLRGEKLDFPENCYHGDYIKDIAAELLRDEKNRYLAENEEETIAYFNSVASAKIMADIRRDLQDFGVTFDSYFSEKELYQTNSVKRLLTLLEEKGFVYKDEDTLWFKTTAFGDDKDRVVVRKNGEPTYFAADIAYHHNKFVRGFEILIDIWGADHHGYMPRLWAAVQALGYSKNDLKIILVQLVNLLRAGEPVAMSTRAGEFVTLREVLDEVGKDAARYNFLMRRSDSHLDFDLEIAKKQSNENPVYYVQYAHARICSIIRAALDRGMARPDYAIINPALLVEPEERKIIKMLALYPEMLEGAAKTLEVHRITFYLNELAGIFHSYYNKSKVVTDDAALSAARLVLVCATGIVLANALKILGVGAPEKM